MSRPSKFRVTLAALLGTTLLSAGCNLLAIGAASVVVTQEFTEHAHAHLITMDAGLVWAHAKATLGELSSGPVDADDNARAASASVDGAKVTLRVQQFDEGRTRISITARKWGLYDNAEAQRVLEKIKRGLR
ncbi:MAG: hypothetical protein QF848_05070 [Planctomycetota bacterium]|jgi:hypothetical protein|nr:hypothetical protein [Planctomycetota bacterium]